MLVRETVCGKIIRFTRDDPLSKSVSEGQHLIYVVIISMLVFFFLAVYLTRVPVIYIQILFRCDQPSKMSPRSYENSFRKSCKLQGKHPRNSRSLSPPGIRSVIIIQLAAHSNEQPLVEGQGRLHDIHLNVLRVYLTRHHDFFWTKYTVSWFTSEMLCICSEFICQVSHVKEAVIFLSVTHTGKPTHETPTDSPALIIIIRIMSL